MKFLLFFVSCFVGIYADETNIVYHQLQLKENVVSPEDPVYGKNVTSRIVGGANASRGMFNYFVRLHLLTSPTTYSVCGGTLFTIYHCIAEIRDQTGSYHTLVGVLVTWCKMRTWVALMGGTIIFRLDNASNWNHLCLRARQTKKNVLELDQYRLWSH